MLSSLQKSIRGDKLVSWWDASPWWAQILIGIGGTVIYLIMVYITYIWAKKLFEEYESQESEIMLAIMWPIGLPCLLFMTVFKILTLPFKIDNDIQEVKQGIDELKKKKEKK